MKDKLYKTGHKKPYYRARAAARFALVLACGLTVIATPVFVTYQVEEAKATSAKAKESPSSEEPESQEEEPVSYHESLED